MESVRLTHTHRAFVEGLSENQGSFDGAIRASVHNVDLARNREADNATLRAHRLTSAVSIVPDREVLGLGGSTTDDEATEANKSRGEQSEEEELDVVVVHVGHYSRERGFRQEEKRKKTYQPWPSEMSERLVVCRTGGVENTLPAAQPTPRQARQSAPTRR